MLNRLWWEFRLGLLAVMLWLGGTAAARADAPLAVDVYGDAEQARRLYLLLPGIRDRKGDFADEGFVRIAQEILGTRKDVALLAVDAHYGYYRKRTVIERLREDVLQRYPNARLSLVGVSLGGFGALRLAEAEPERIDEILLLAPFLGPAEYLPRARSGDFHDRRNDSSMQRALNRVWPWLQTARARPQVTLAYGESDRFVPFYETLRPRAAHIEFTSVPGGHDWHAWRPLWRQWLLGRRP